MPELPEVETVRRSLEPRVVGHRVVEVQAARVKLREGIEPADWHALVAGRKLLALRRRGKYLLADLGEAVAVLHLGMSGRLVLARPGRERAPHTHLELFFDHGLILRLSDPRRFGVALVIPSDRLDAYAPLAGLGPDPVLEEFEGALLDAASLSRAPIRSLLLDQTVIAGLGNIYANEALERAGIHPLRRGRAISKQRVVALAGAIREVLREALEAGGTTLADGGFVDASGDPGYFAVNLRVYGRSDEPCLRCGTAIRRRSAGGRSVYFCPRCQR